MSITTETTIPPFIKWAGGKRQLLSELKQNMSTSFETYYEPFIGGGALFFALSSKIKHAVLSDSNAELINAYNIIKSSPQELIDLLKIHKSNHCEDYYYDIRSRHNLSNNIEKAARFIYLNKTCYNGLFRVNKSNQFNVPIGKYKNPSIVQEDIIFACHNALQKADIILQTYEGINPSENDFIYCDPPYHPKFKTSFTSYTSNNFTEKDHIELHNFIKELTEDNIHVMISNSDTEFIHNLYSEPIFNIIEVSSPCMINCKSDKRRKKDELIIKNFI